MYNGFFDIFIGFCCITLSFFRKNKITENASFIRRHNKGLLVIFGVWMVVIGTIDFLEGNGVSLK